MDLEQVTEYQLLKTTEAMSLVKRSKTITFTGLDLIITAADPAYTSATPQYYNLCTVKSVESVFTPNPSTDTNDHPVIAQVVINWTDTQGQNAKFYFDVQDVTNQPAWLATPAGLAQAVADIHTARVASCAGSSSTSDALLQDILDALIAFKDDEYIKVKDANGDVFALQTSLDEGTGVTTYSYINADGTPGTPVAPITFVLQESIQRTPTFLRPTGSNGTVAAGTYSMSFASVGTGNAIVGGIILKPGETLNFDAGAINNTLAAVAYDTTTNVGAELIIITLT